MSKTMAIKNDQAINNNKKSSAWNDFWERNRKSEGYLLKKTLKN